MSNIKVQLYAPKEYGRQPYWFFDGPPEVFEGGCGPGDGIGDRIVPDKLLGLSIQLACAIHDFMYKYGETWDDKEFADRLFLQNMNRIIKAAGGVMKYPRYALALAYHAAVSYGGTLAFWNNKHSDDLQWVKI